jgi:hypothetical protein
MCPRGSTAYVITRALLIPLYFLGAGHYNNGRQYEGERWGVYFGSFFPIFPQPSPFWPPPDSAYIYIYIYIYIYLFIYATYVYYTCMRVYVYVCGVCGVKASQWKYHLLCTATAAALVREQ